MINPLAAYRALQALEGLKYMSKTQIAELLRAHGPTVVKLTEAIAQAATNDTTLLPDVADALDGQANVAGTVLKHLGTVSAVLDVLKGDDALLVKLRLFLPRK